jgi:predicted enzyme related to lactoylglutathione lyase
MTPAARSMVAATYVRDIETSRVFYELLGFSEHSVGRAATSGWLALQQNGLLVLLASTRPPLDVPQLPLLFYFFYDDVDAVVAVLSAAGVAVTRTGHPPHALGGEVKVADPDGNTVLLGQRDRSASQAPAAADENPGPILPAAGGRDAGRRARRYRVPLPGRRPAGRSVPEPGRGQARRRPGRRGLGLPDARG